MLRFALTLFVGCLAAAPAAAAPIVLDLPAQSGTFTGNTRGYWFTAPVDFVITGLRVPTDASSGNQSIALLRFDSTPPVFSSTTNTFTQLFYQADVPGTSFIDTNITVNAGDVIGVLGSRGGVNSYGPGGYTSNIFGNPITLTRLGMQFPLATVAPQNLWQDPSSPISRVEIRYDVASLQAVPEPATLTLLGALGLSAVVVRRRKRSMA